ncbi:MAG TPA: DinB family protein [Vicinamibacterales bacterium]|nr:DinB family protein [Vicinamibacterales bacterium]
MHRVVTMFLGVTVLLAAAQGAFAAPQDGRGQGRSGGGAGRGPQGPPITTLAGDVQSDLDRTRELIVNLVNAMPEDKFGFKPTPAQQSFGERVMHIVTVDGFLFNSLGGKTAAPTINQKATTKADILAALKQSYDWQAAVLKEFNDQQLVERVTPPPFLGSSASRVKVFYYDLQHTEDIYGQLVVYLRLNGVTPPASQRGGV